jgi:hypothetical protein
METYQVVENSVDNPKSDPESSSETLVDKKPPLRGLNETNKTFRRAAAKKGPHGRGNSQDDMYSGRKV